MLKTAPDPVDVQDLQFKLRCRLKVFENVEIANFSHPCSLVACASRFGLVFVGTNRANFQVIQLKQIEEFTKSDGDRIDYSRRNVPLPSPPKFLSVNCEHAILCVVIERNSCPCAIFYDVKSFWQQNIAQLAELRLSATPGVHVLEINWNPALAAIFTACKSDGTLGIYEIKNSSIDINELPAAAAVTCFCWSPKGKQIAVGSRDGKITQYKPDLKAVKVISAPLLKEPHSLISLQWVSNYQYIGIFQPVNTSNQNSCLLVIDAPKTGDPTYVNYDDICYSNGNARPFQFYTILQQNWNILMVASANSMEVGILGNSGECWTQWIMGDAARAELPLSSSHQETLPVGFGLDIGSTQPLPWGESTLPPCPILFLLSHYGMLCCFNVVNLKEGIPTICTPPDSIKDTSGVLQFVNKSEVVKQEVKIPTIQQPTVELPKMVQPKITTACEIQSNTPANKPLNFSTNQASSLFGGQATLIPITQNVKSTPPQTLHPTLPYQSLYPSLSSENSAVQIPASTVSSALITKTAAPTVIQSTILNTPQLKPAEELAKSDVINIKAEEEAESLFSQMVREECLFLQSEVKAVLHQGKSLKLNLGSDADKTAIIQTTKSISDFFKELADICTTQNAEVHVLKQNLLQSWAWYEEVKSRHIASTNESMVILQRAQPLDPASEKQLEDIRHANYYLESQIAQAHRALDEQWESFQDYCKKTHRMQVPTMEMIFQTMVKQNAILRKQNFILKDISSRIKNKSRSAVGSSLLFSVDDAAGLPDELKRLRLHPEDICQIQYEHVVNRTKNFTKKKSKTLRSFLKKREYPHISAVKPQLSTSIIQASPSMKLKLKSLSVAQENVAARPSFVQSTPKPLTKVEAPSETPSTPIEGLQNFTLKFEAKNFNKTPEKTFVPLSKSLIASSPNSAFVSTSFGSTVSTSTPSSSSFKPVIFATPATTATMKTPLNFHISTAVSTQPIIISTNTSKPFSFTNTSLPSVFVQEVSNTNVTKPFIIASTSAGTVGNMTKPTFSFNLQTVAKTATTAAAPTFGKVETKNVATAKPTTSTFNVIVSKPSSSSLNLTTSKPTPAASDVAASTAKATPIFGTFSTSTVASPSFVLSTAPTIWGATNEKSNETAAAKPFIFSSVVTPKITVAATTPQTRFVAPVTITVSSTVSTVPSSSAENNAKDLRSTPSVTVTLKSATQPPVVTTTSSLPPVFGSPQTTTKSSLLGSFPVTISFGAATTSAAQSPAFGAKTTTSIFGTAPTTTSQSSIFGSTPISTTSQSQVFGMFGDGAQKNSIFGSTAPPNSTQSSVFGSSGQTPIFGAAVTTTSAPTFGQSQSIFDIPKSTPSVFGQSSGFGSSASFGGTNAFGSPATSFGQPSGSIFGNAATTTSGSIFGGTPTTSSAFGTSSPIFGAPVSSTSSVFGSGSVFSSTANTSAGSFGFGTLSVGTAPTTSSSGFGVTAASNPFRGDNKNVFGGASATSTNSVFGSSGGSLFGGPQQNFGGSSFGNQSVFGQQQSTFGQSSFGGGTFGQQSSGPFSGSSSGSVAQSGFGAAPSFQKPGGFGGSPVFGSTPAFGSPPSFGGAPSFGSSPTFGNSSKVFGAGSPAFGSSSTTQNTAFGNLANQQT
ncbi:nuclear pore complex protein Nup214, partial [Asbolus verrucosus]